MHSSLIWLSLVLLVGYSLADVASNNVSLRILPSGFIVLRVDDALNVTCQVVSSATEPTMFKLEWFPPTVPAIQHSRINFTSQSKSLSFRITDIQEDDSGVYVCNASSQEDIWVASANVTIVVKPKKGSCGQSFFTCATKQCIPLRFLCDGVTDCPDGSDEAVVPCGRDPCKGKLRCDGGRCLHQKYCCDQSTDQDCHTLHSSCCAKNSEDVSGKSRDQQSGVMDHHRRYESDMSFLQSTIYTIIGCAIAFIFIVTIMVVAVCRVHMKQAAMSLHPRRLVGRRPLYWPRRPAQDLEAYLHDLAVGGPSHSFNCPHPAANFLVTYNINNGVQLVGDVLEPPPYSEVIQTLSINGPPPPYTSAENLIDVDFTSADSSPSSSDSDVRVSSALLRANVSRARESE